MFLLAIFGLALAGEFSQLYATEAEASSFLKSSWNKYNENYHPNYVLDNNPKTAWVEGVDGNGEGQKIVIPISAVSQIGRVKIRIKNGYQMCKDDGFSSNSSISNWLNLLKPAYKKIDSLTEEDLSLIHI